MSLSQEAARQRLKAKFNGDKQAYEKEEPDNFAQYQKRLENYRKSSAMYRQSLKDDWNPQAYHADIKYHARICPKILRDIYKGSDEKMEKADPVNFEQLEKRRASWAKYRINSRKRKAQEAGSANAAVSLARTSPNGHSVSPPSFFFAAPCAPSLPDSLLKKLTEYRLRDDRASSDTLLQNCTIEQLTTILRVIYNNDKVDFLTYAPNAYQRYQRYQEAITFNSDISDALGECEALTK